MGASSPGILTMSLGLRRHPHTSLFDDLSSKRSTGLAGVYNSGAGSAGIMRALEQFDPQQRVTWVAHELSDDHRQYLQAGALAMVIDQDPDMQAFKGLRYLVERTDPNTGPTSLTPGCEFHLYFSENLREGRYLSTPQRSPELRLAQGRGAISGWMR